MLVGAAAMIFFPLMSQGYVQSADALFGVQQKGGFRSIVTLMSFLFGAWAMLLLLFSFRQHDQDLELAAKLAGVAASTIAVFKYDILVSIIVRYSDRARTNFRCCCWRGSRSSPSSCCCRRWRAGSLIGRSDNAA